jgi:Flp pilus assembly protein TadG
MTRRPPADMTTTLLRRWLLEETRAGLRDARGQSLVEFALASVIFFMTLFGTIEFGRGIWQYNMVSDLAQEGARWASVHGSSSLSPANQAAVQTFVRSRALSFSVNVTTDPGAGPVAVAPGSTISVTVTSSFQPLTAFIPNAVWNLTSTATMVVSR